MSDLTRPVRPKERFLVFGAPLIEDAEIREVVNSLQARWLGTGPKVARFEEDFRAYKRAAHSVAVSSCSAALHLSMLAAGLGATDEVITTPMTFCATINSIAHTGALPVLADVDPSTMNIDPREVERSITSRTKALLVVHFAGRPCQMSELSAIAQEHGLVLIEDCAHAIEAEYRGRPTGAFGRFGCFSFYATKNVVTGEGGMVLTRLQRDAERIKILALHGMSHDAWRRFSDRGYQHYDVVDCGFKYNMMDLQAAIGIHQLARVESSWKRRLGIWRRYDEAFTALPIGLPAPFDPATRHALHLYTLRIDESRCGITRDGFLEAMTAHGIGVGVHYRSVAEHSFYRRTYGWSSENTPHAGRIGRETVSIPLSAALTDEDVEDVINAVRRTLGVA